MNTWDVGISSTASTIWTIDIDTATRPKSAGARHRDRTMKVIRSKDRAIILAKARSVVPEATLSLTVDAGISGGLSRFTSQLYATMAWGTDAFEAKFSSPVSPLLEV